VDAINGGADVTQILISPTSGGEPIPITDGLTAAWNPSWSQDNARLYFISNQGGAMDLWQQRVSSEGRPRGAPERLTTGIGMRSAAFSPDGAKLAYSRGPRQAADTVWRVPILNDRPATWKDAEQLISDAAFIQFLDLSPDKKLLAFSSDRSGNQDLWIQPLDGSDPIQLTTEPTPDWAPRFSPDGKGIVFYAYRSGNRDVWVMPVEGGPSRQLTFDPTEDEVPTWAPDGKRIAFVSRRGGNRDIWVMEADGREPRQLTTRTADDYMPEYSPNGAFIVFASSTDQRLVQIPAEGGEIDLLADGDTTPRWAPDGEVLYFPKYSTMAHWALSVKSGGVRRVTDLVGPRGNLGMGLATDGAYLYFTWSEEIGDIWVMDVVP
jgi:TolB protein